MRVKEDVLSTELRIDWLELGAFTPRISVDQKYVDELAEDIDKNGLQKPIIVRVHPEKKTSFQLIDGEYRVRAMKKLGRSLIRAEVRTLTDSEALFLAMKINEMHGKRLTELEEGLHMLRLNEELGWSEEKIAKEYSRSQQWVSDRIKIARNASEDLRNYHSCGKISISHARKIVELPKEVQGEVVKKVVNENLSHDQTAVIVNAIKKEPERKDEILAMPIGAIAETREETERAVELAPEEPVMEVVKCPHCGKEIWVNWITHKLYAKYSD